MDESDISLRHLKVLAVLLEVQSLTRAAEILGSNQSTISKALGKLRIHFGDPLFVRVGASMHATPRALEIAEPLRGLVENLHLLRSSASAFDPRKSNREFKVIVTDVGMIQLVPALMRELEQASGSLRLKAVPLDSRQFSTKLEAGDADVAIGAFPDAPSILRHQRLYADAYVSVVRQGHPRLSQLSKVDVFLRERHIIVTASSTGHAAHQLLEQFMLSKLDTAQIRFSIPSFVTCAFVASRTDAVGTMPKQLAEFLAHDLKLALFPTPFSLPAIQIEQFWHERVSRDPGHQWFRARVRSMCGKRLTGSSANMRSNLA